MMHAMCASPARDARRSLDLLLSQMAFFGVSDTERMNTAKPVYVRPLTDSERQTLTTKIPMASTRCFITASMIDSTPTAASAIAKALTGCWATRFTRRA